MAGPAFTSARLDYHAVTPDNVAVFARGYQNPELMTHLGGAMSPQDCLARQDKWLRHWAEHGFGPYVLYDRATGNSVGVLALFESAICEESVLEIGWLVFAEFQRQGLAFEAALRTLEFARQRFPARAIIAMPDHRNTASNRICEKLGMTTRGRVEFPFRRGVLQATYWRFDP